MLTDHQHVLFNLFEWDFDGQQLEACDSEFHEPSAKPTLPMAGRGQFAGATIIDER